MIILYALIAGIIITGFDYWLFRDKNKKVVPEFILTFIKDTIVLNLVSLGMMKYLLNIPDVFYVDRHGPLFFIKYVVFTCAVGIVGLFFKGVLPKMLPIEKCTEKPSAGTIAAQVISSILFTVGAALFTATNWGKLAYDDVAPDQLIINLMSPVAGTGSDIISTIFEGPVFETAVLTALFCSLIFSNYRFVRRKKENKSGFNNTARKVISLVLSVATLFGGLTYGILKFNLNELYAGSTTYIEDNYVNPNSVTLTFPKEKRNLIHIYLESVENSYYPKELGGYMQENLMPELTELAYEGVSFSQHEKGKFGGPYHTVGSGWSVAGMVNMEVGIPLKIPMDGNSYGKGGNFLPGAVALGDILAAQGYEQTLMLGSDSVFGGLDTYFTTHGNFKIFDYRYAIKKGLIPEDYYEWWGYEDDKLYEYAKDEITRLSQTGNPFHFEMETADTHFPNGYLSPGVENKFDSQYANVIAFSTKEAVKFVRWIQQQDFYENTTIVITGDHISMDKNFFANFDPDYKRTALNIFLNTGLDDTNAYNRTFAQFDMFPTIIRSMGIEIEGNRLALGADLFSGEKTLIERDGFNNVNEMLNSRSSFFNSKFLIGPQGHTFKNKNIKYK